MCEGKCVLPPNEHADNTLHTPPPLTSSPFIPPNYTPSCPSEVYTALPFSTRYNSKYLLRLNSYIS